MEKTIDQIREEVIAECKCLCPKSNDIHWLDNVGRNYLFRESDDVWMLNCVDNVFSIIAHDDNPSIWLYTYRLLGLESRAKDAEIARLRSALADLSSEAKRTWIEWHERMVNGSGEGSQKAIFASQIGKLAQYADDAKNAMKGGQGD